MIPIHQWMPPISGFRGLGASQKLGNHRERTAVRAACPQLPMFIPRCRFWWRQEFPAAMRWGHHSSRPLPVRNSCPSETAVQAPPQRLGFKLPCGGAQMLEFLRIFPRILMCKQVQGPQLSSSNHNVQLAGSPRTQGSMALSAQGCGGDHLHLGDQSSRLWSAGALGCGCGWQVWISLGTLWPPIWGPHESGWLSVQPRGRQSCVANAWRRDLFPPCKGSGPACPSTQNWSPCGQLGP